MNLLLQYAWVLVILVALEGILAADNALVMAIMVKHLPDDQRKKALFYGLAGAFVLRFGSLFVISYLVNIWQVQAIGAIYLLFIAGTNLFKRFVLKKDAHDMDMEQNKSGSGSGFWVTVVKVELADIAFAVDSILAAVAMALTLPDTGIGHIGGLDTGKFLVVFTGGFLGLLIMRFAANWFVQLLHQRPSMETAAFMIVGWVGVKLVVYTLAHPQVAIISEAFPHSLAWKVVFWGVLLAIFAGGWFISGDKDSAEVKQLG